MVFGIADYHYDINFEKSEMSVGERKMKNYLNFLDTYY